MSFVYHPGLEAVRDGAKWLMLLLLPGRFGSLKPLARHGVAGDRDLLLHLWAGQWAPEESRCLVCDVAVEFEGVSCGATYQLE